MKDKLHRVMLSVVYVGSALLWMVLITTGASKPLKTESASTLQTSLQRETLRLHVVANSNSLVDQRRKIAVKNAIASALSPKMSQCGSREEAIRVVRASIPKLKELAEGTLKEMGADNSVTVHLQKKKFPYKRYGEFLFPAGEYESLQIEIGKSQGKNWWCVMYPTLCFLDEGYQVVDAESGEVMQKVLTPDEYRELVLTPSSEPVQEEQTEVTYGFWLVDWWNGLFH